MRFRLRTLFVATTILAIGLGLLVSWWTRPYALTGSYPNGQRAWEQWERRTPTLQIQHLKTIRWYPDGSIACHSLANATGTMRYYAPNGDLVSDSRTWLARYGDLIQGAEEDAETFRPYMGILSWWNGW